MGQLRMVIRAKFLIDVVGLNKIQGLPFKVVEVTEAIEKQLGASATTAPATTATQPQANA